MLEQPMKRPALFALFLVSCQTTSPPPPSTSTSAPVASASAPPPDVAMGPNKAVTAVNAAIRSYWEQNATQPSAEVDDARYLRRVALDLTGLLPTEQQISEFQQDQNPDKRARAVEKFLNSKGYAEHWTDYWDNLLMTADTKGKQIDRLAFRVWLHDKFEKNTSWDKFVTELITATGTSSTGDRSVKDMRLAAAQDVGDTKPDQGVNGAVNWMVRYAQNPQDLAGTASKVFMGVQIQCAQCHDHKTEAWKQDDFRKFTACFMAVRTKPVDGRSKGEVTSFEVTDLDHSVKAPKKNVMQEELKQYQNAKPTALDGTALSSDSGRRKSLAAWMTAKQNPYFAQAFVNRMWQELLGKGFVEPVDDFRPNSPVIAPAALNALKDDFIENGFDVKRLLKNIVLTEAYQRSSQPAKRTDDKTNAALWARYPLKSLSPEVMLDIMLQATDAESAIEKAAGNKVAEYKFALQRQFRFVFDTDDDNNRDDFDGTVSQALMLLNGPVTNIANRAIPGTTLSKTLAAQSSDEEKIKTLYLRTLSRAPRADETARWVTYINEPHEAVKASDNDSNDGPKGKRNKKGKKGPVVAPPLRLPWGPGTAREQAYEDVFWALLNSSEFLFNH